MLFRKPNFWLSQTLKALAAVSLLLLCVSDLQAQQTFGYVLDISGDWILNGTTKLSRGSQVSVGGVITASAPDSSSYIVIANGSGGFFDKRTCRNSGECARAIHLPRSAVNDTSLTQKAAEIIFRIFRRDPAKSSSFSSRGSDLQDGLTKLNDQKLDLSQVFRNLQSNRYLVRFENLEKNQTGKRPTKPLPFEWDANKPMPLAAPGLAPGLYKVSIQDVSLLESEDTESSDSEAWVLVTSATDYARAAQTYDAVLDTTRKWGTNVKQSAVRQFLRATLKFISTERTR